MQRNILDSPEGATMTTTPTFRSPLLVRYAAINNVIISRLVDSGRAEGDEDARRKYDLDSIADAVLDPTTFEMIVTDDAFEHVVDRNDKSTLGAKLRNLADWFRPVDEPEPDVMDVLGRVADSLTWDQIDLLGEFVADVRGAAEERGRANFIAAMDRALAARQDTE